MEGVVGGGGRVDIVLALKSFTSGMSAFRVSFARPAWIRMKSISCRVVCACCRSHAGRHLTPGFLSASSRSFLGASSLFLILAASFSRFASSFSSFLAFSFCAFSLLAARCFAFLAFFAFFFFFLDFLSFLPFASESDEEEELELESASLS